MSLFTIKNSRMVMQFDLYSTLMIKHGNIILIVFHLSCYSKHKFYTILKPMWRTLLVSSCKHVDSKHFYQILSLHFIYDLITIMEYSCKHEFSTINMLYYLKKIVILHPYLPMMAIPPQQLISSAHKVAIVERFD